MLDPRIYRAGFVAVALAVIVFAFSLQNLPSPLTATLVPDAFNGSNAFSTMTSIAKKGSEYTNRQPGSPPDRNLAGYVAHMLKANSFSVSTDRFAARTADGTRTLENVIGSRAGMTNGTIMIVAHRDSIGPGAAADASGTATLLTLASVLSGETLNHTIVLASTSGSVGAAGAARLAQDVPGPVDAVIVLGDLASKNVRYPVVVPWTSSELVAPPLLRQTIASALSAQAGLSPGGTSLTGQIVHLAVPLTLSEQAPFGRAGEPAVLLSLSGEHPPVPNAAVDEGQIDAMGRTILQTITALDSGPQVPAPSTYIVYDGKMIPDWAIRLLILALIVPVAMATVDGLARVRRRGQEVARWVLWLLAAAVPFLLAAAFAVFARLTGILNVVPAGPVGPHEVALHGRGTAILVLIGVVIVGGVAAFARLLPLGRAAARPADGSRSGRRAEGDDVTPGATAALMIVMCALVLVTWVRNPFAAALMILALHLWMWALAPGLPLSRPVRLALVAVGLAPVLFVAVYYGSSLGFSPVGLAWTWVLMVAGGQVGATTLLIWSVLGGCAAGACAIALRSARTPRATELPAVTVRGPVTYAGPGSLGGTESALRR